jgi:phenylpropionate dioxygenase-like ring-hydroxylating dioxygenase large terminal subunit
MKPRLLELLEKLVNHVHQNTMDKSEAVHIEPATSFLDQNQWQQEKEQFFLGTPQVVGFSGELCPGSYLATETAGVPVVITRDLDGSLNAFINACSHRGARVASGCGTAKRLNCGFHGWSFALDGSLAGRPRDKDFEPACESDNLTRLPVSENHGVLVVGPRPDIPQAKVDEFLDDIGEALDEYPLHSMHSLETRRLDVKANWKLVTHLSHESYHFACLHRDSLAPVMTDHAVVETWGKHSRWAFPMKGIGELAEKDRSEWPTLFPGVVNHTLFPGTILVANPEDAQLIRTEPGASPGETVVYYTGAFYVPEGEDPEKRREAALNAYNFGGDIFSKEDVVAAEQCQQGIATRQQPVSAGRNEPVVSHWFRLWQETLEK